MPDFAHDLGHGDPGTAYRCCSPPTPRARSSPASCSRAEGEASRCARTRTVILLAIGGLRRSAASPRALISAGAPAAIRRGLPRTLVQQHVADAGADERAGREARPRARLYNMGAVGLRTFSGVTVGVGGSFLGIHASLAGSSLVLFAVVAILMATMARAPRRQPASVPIPKFARSLGTLRCELRNLRDTSKSMFLVWLLDLKFLSARAVRGGGTSNPPH